MLDITKEEFIELYNTHTKDQLEEVLGLSRYYINILEKQCGLTGAKKAGRPPGTKIKLKE